MGERLFEIVFFGLVEGFSVYGVFEGRRRYLKVVGLVIVLVGVYNLIDWLDEYWYFSVIVLNDILV